MAWQLAQEAFGVEFPAYWTIAQVTDTPLARRAVVVFTAFADEEQRNQHKADTLAGVQSQVKTLADKTIAFEGDDYTAFVAGKALVAMKAAVYAATADEFEGAKQI